MEMLTMKLILRVFSALKGRGELAQGEALRWDTKKMSPERATRVRRTALSGLTSIVTRFVGLRPTLIRAALSGLRFPKGWLWAFMCLFLVGCGSPRVSDEVRAPSAEISELIIPDLRFHASVKLGDVLYFLTDASKEYSMDRKGIVFVYDPALYQRLSLSSDPYISHGVMGHDAYRYASLSDCLVKVCSLYHLTAVEKKGEIWVSPVEISEAMAPYVALQYKISLMSFCDYLAMAFDEYSGQKVTFACEPEIARRLPCHPGLPPLVLDKAMWQWVSVSNYMERVCTAYRVSMVEKEGEVWFTDDTQEWLRKWHEKYDYGVDFPED